MKTDNLTSHKWKTIHWLACGVRRQVMSNHSGFSYLWIMHGEIRFDLLTSG